MRSFRSAPSLLVGLGTLVGAGRAAADTLTIAFSSGSQSVPLSPWLSAALAVAVGLVALALFKRRGAPRVFLLAAALLVAGGAFVLPRDTLAAPAYSLTSSPYTMNLVCQQTMTGAGVGPAVSSGMNFTSAVPAGITLTSVTITGGPLAVDPASTCKAGTHLDGAATCIVVIDYTGCQQV